MEISFLNKGIYHYIDAKAGSVSELEASGRMYQIHMLTENEMLYILHSEMLCSNGEVWLTHNTESCYCLQNMLMQKSINGSVLRNLLEQILAGIKEIEPYLLDAADLILRLDYMFWNPVLKCVRMLCVPGYQMPVCEQLRLLLESIMPRFDHSDYEGERMLYRCHNLVSDEWQGLAGLMEFLQTWQTGTDITKLDGNGIPADISIKNCLNDVRKDNQKKEQKKEQKEQQTEEDDEDDEVNDTVFTKRFFLFVLAGGAALALIIKYLFFDGTTGTAIFGVGWLLALVVLAIMTVREKEDDSDAAMQAYASADNQESPACISVKIPGETPEYVQQSVAMQNHMCTKLVPLTNGALEPLRLSNAAEMVTIGRDRKTDYRVMTTQISRMHAKLYKKADGLFLEDLNSTNGTFVNAKRIPALTEYKLNKGDVVGFANEEFFVS